MSSYYDSSLILSAVLEQRSDIDYSEAWDDVPNRFSSNLLKIECIIGIRRAGLQQNFNPEDDWITLRLDRLERYFDGINFRIVDEAIEEVVRQTTQLAQCRSLDAIHLSTALYLQARIGEPLSMCTLDNRLRALAAAFGFPVVPGQVSS